MWESVITCYRVMGKDKKVRHARETRILACNCSSSCVNLRPSKSCWSVWTSSQLPKCGACWAT
jgi:hypothetical protein